MIDLTQCQLIVLSSPTSEIDFRMQGWFMERSLPFQNIAVWRDEGTVIENRNKIIHRLVLPRADSFEWFIFIDKDVCTNRLTQPFLDEVSEDVVGCSYDVAEHAWLLPNQFHMGLVRVRSSVFKLGIEPPYFMFEYNGLGTEIVKCECNYFKDKLEAKGVTITRRGKAGHSPSRSWHK